jgi:hypothetical protein
MIAASKLPAMKTSLILLCSGILMLCADSVDAAQWSQKQNIPNPMPYVSSGMDGSGYDYTMWQIYNNGTHSSGSAVSRESNDALSGSQEKADNSVKYYHEEWERPDGNGFAEGFPTVKAEGVVRLTNTNGAGGSCAAQAVGFAQFESKNVSVHAAITESAADSSGGGMIVAFTFDIPGVSGTFSAQFGNGFVIKHDLVEDFGIVDEQCIESWWWTGRTRVAIQTKTNVNWWSSGPGSYLTAEASMTADVAPNTSLGEVPGGC